MVIGTSSNVARTVRTESGTCRPSTASIAASGSVAVTAMSRAANTRVALPVPAPISNALATARPAYVQDLVDHRDRVGGAEPLVVRRRGPEGQGT